MCTDRVLGLLSQTMGNSGQAQIHFEDALVFCRNAGYRPELAWTCCDYADTLLRRNESGDGTKAMSLLDESLSIATELGMRPLMERVKERIEQAQAQPSPPPAYPAGLSLREVEVLRLISAGKTDREIAEELFISFRTVGNHVRNILNKTNTANRTEAATFAAHQGLT
ncbi:MAG: response regulator transcription factor [Chloroflexi bacterium]|nr:response regulator transcription factor [Chloroflexota bacterium]